MAQKAMKEANIPPAEGQGCFMCGSEAKHLHHPDYEKPTEVVPLCISCHDKIHIVCPEMSFSATNDALEVENDDASHIPGLGKDEKRESNK